ncbi:MAG: hypothetical protein DMD96_15940 [Candidatus Rokuibacteriota bacterium]|nr:MAG: hypothetical protein DMD96_15940 [Candidatus Rokubacteria bacterium]
MITAGAVASGAFTAGSPTDFRSRSTRSKYTMDAPFTSRWRNSKQSISRKLSCLILRTNESVSLSTMNRIRGGRDGETCAIG